MTSSLVVILMFGRNTLSFMGFLPEHLEGNKWVWNHGSPPTCRYLQFLMFCRELRHTLEDLVSTVSVWIKLNCCENLQNLLSLLGFINETNFWSVILIFMISAKCIWKFLYFIRVSCSSISSKSVSVYVYVYTLTESNLFWFNLTWSTEEELNCFWKLVVIVYAKRQASKLVIFRP